MSVATNLLEWKEHKGSVYQTSAFNGELRETADGAVCWILVFVM